MHGAAPRHPRRSALCQAARRARAAALALAAVLAGATPCLGQEGYRPALDALHYHVELDLGSPEHVRATASVVLVARSATDSIVLDLFGMEVTGVRAAPRGDWERGDVPETAFRHGAGLLRIALPRGAVAGDTLRVVVDYRGVPGDGLILRRTVHGQPAVFADNWPNRIRHWIPSIDHPSDKATVSWTVRVPPGWEVVANGARVGGGSGDAVWSYRMERPVPTYTMVIGAADFAVHTVSECADGGTTTLRPDGCVHVTAWSFPADSAHAARVFGRAGDMVAFYSDLVAPYPYHKLAHVQSATRFGGMENAGAIFYAEGPLALGADIEPTVAHETAHQWFGDDVTEADWRHLWLSEGFATYFGALFFERADGPERFHAMLAQDARAYFESTVVDEPVVDPGRPAYERLVDLLNENQYEKGAWVLHMLRGLLGDDAFFEGIRRYYGAHAPGNALTEDLRRALEAASGRDLDWFFEQWLYRPGYPVLRVAWTGDPRSAAVRVRVEQAQPARWPAFRLPLILAFETPAGEVRRTVELSGRTDTFDLTLPAAPTALRVDPDGWLLARIEPPRRAAP